MGWGAGRTHDPNNKIKQTKKELTKEVKTSRVLSLMNYSLDTSVSAVC